jgi:hypothetical protein
VGVLDDVGQRGEKIQQNARDISEKAQGILALLLMKR